MFLSPTGSIVMNGEDGSGAGAGCAVFSGAGAVVILVVAAVPAAGFPLCVSFEVVIWPCCTGADSIQPAITRVATTRSMARQIRVLGLISVEVSWFLLN